MSMNKFYKYKGYKPKKYDQKLRTYNNIVFDSKLEMEYYQYLESNSSILSFIYQPKSFKYMNFNCLLTNKKIVRLYTPDFFVIKKHKNKVIYELIDIKGGFSPIEWKIKKDAILKHLNKKTIQSSFWYVDYFIELIKETDFYNKRYESIIFIESSIKKQSFFTEITKTKTGGWLELNKFIQQKLQYKKDRKNEVKELVNKFKILSKKEVKKWKTNKNTCISIDFMIPYIQEVCLSKAWKVYPYLKQNKQYINKVKKINNFINNFKKMNSSKNRNTILKYQKLCITQIIEISSLKYEYPQKEYYENRDKQKRFNKT